jgi:Alcohol dehydrogenase GroES-like domain/Aldehyde dehydrogenase family
MKEPTMATATYWAVQATKPGLLEVVEREVTAPGPGQVRIRIEACGVCHSDVLTVGGLAPDIRYPRVPGHEVVGKIDALGEGVSLWKVGQRVGVGFLAGNCGRCTPCREGDFVNCQNQPVSGVASDGGYAEVMIADAHALAAVPDDLAPAEAAPLLCAGVTTYNAIRNSTARPGDLVAIQGIGGLGHLGVQYLDPTIVYPVSWDDRIMEDEVFGPILPVLTYRTLDEALGRIAATPRPLAAFIFSRNQSAIDRFAGELSSGGGAGNQVNVHLFVESMPFGGLGRREWGTITGNTALTC